jgi:hypothetical protein
VAIVSREAAMAIGAGLAGAAAVTALNEAGRRLWSRAPRAELLGERGVKAIARGLGRRPPRGRSLFVWALAGEALSNTGYYALAARARRPLLAGGLLGLTAGVLAVALPAPLGLGRRPTGRSAQTAALTIAWYTAGGLAAGWVAGRRRESWSY